MLVLERYTIPNRRSVQSCQDRTNPCTLSYSWKQPWRQSALAAGGTVLTGQDYCKRHCSNPVGGDEGVGDGFKGLRDRDVFKLADIVQIEETDQHNNMFFKVLTRVKGK